MIVILQQGVRGFYVTGAFFPFMITGVEINCNPRAVQKDSKAHAETNPLYLLCSRALFSKQRHHDHILSRSHLVSGALRIRRWENHSQGLKFNR